MTKKIQIEALVVEVDRNEVERAIVGWARSMVKSAPNGAQFTGHAIVEADKFGGFTVTILKGSAD